MEKLGGKRIAGFEKVRNRFGALRGDIRLVEFGDYCCPFCKSFQPDLDAFLSHHPQVDYEFRDLPLTTLHPLAFDAAILANLQRSDAGPDRGLMAAKLTGADILTLRALRKTREASPDAAYYSVYSDMNLARSLGINGTPAFIVILPDGSGFLVPQSSQLKDFLGWKYPVGR